ncbi:MAG: response regulator transcription factor [Spirochaetota bacterium]
MKTGGPGDRIKILIVDDQTLFATSLRLVLENSGKDEFEIVGIASNGRHCVEMVESLRPDLVLLDVYMPEMDGVEAAAIVHAKHPETKIMMLTTFDDDAYVKNALRSGASGYVLKTIDADELVTCIRAVHKGMVLISSAVGSRIFADPDPGRAEGIDDSHALRIETIHARFPELKPREAEILRLLLTGCNNHQIADELLIAEQTVRNYTSAIYTKIGVNDRLQAIQLFGSMR